MQHRLSFANFNLLSDDVVEVVVDEGVELSLEMVEECHQFIQQNVHHHFGLLINRVNQYSYSYEAQLSLASHEYLKAIAFVYYSQETLTHIENLHRARMFDEWNSKVFSGLELGWQQALFWLQQELSAVKIN